MSKTKQGQDAVKKLQKWLKNSENTEAKLAGLLGYKTSETVRAWLKKGYIPSHQIAGVITVINGKGN